MRSAACTTVPTIDHDKYTFPKEEAFTTTTPKRPFAEVGMVRDRVDFASADPDLDKDPQAICRNYFNKSVRNLVKYAKGKGADAVIGVKSIVFYPNETFEAFPRPECADDGIEGQVLTQGTAIKWVNLDEKEVPKARRIRSRPGATAPIRD